MQCQTRNGAARSRSLPGFGYQAVGTTALRLARRLHKPSGSPYRSGTGVRYTCEERTWYQNYRPRATLRSNYCQQVIYACSVVAITRAVMPRCGGLCLAKRKAAYVMMSL